MSTNEQLATVQKSNFETFFGLTTKAFEGFEQLIDLNVQVAKSALGDAAAAAQAVLSVKDGQELLALQATLWQPAAEKAAAYYRDAYEIATSVGAELNRIAEATSGDAQSKFIAAFDSAVKNAPAGTENVVALFRSATTAATTAFENVQKAAKQAVDVADANFQALSSTATRATQAATKVRRAA